MVERKNKMRMNRRDFLKGMMALAGAAALTQLPDWQVAEEIATPLLQTRPYGRLGSIRLGEEWYSLEDASITKHKGNFLPIYTPDSVNFVSWEGQLTAPSWSIDVFMGEDAVKFDYLNTSNLDFEIDGIYRSFAGQGYISEYRVENMMDNQILFGLYLEGVGNLQVV